MNFQLERFEDAMMDLVPLLKKHYLEVAHYQDIPLHPDYDQYLKLDDMGLIKTFTARKDGKLLGYAIFFVRHNIHYKTSLQAVQDVIFIDKEHRGFGKEFIKWCDSELQKLGVQAVYHHIKAEHNWGPMLERMGYQLVDLIYARRLD